MTTNPTTAQETPATESPLEEVAGEDIVAESSTQRASKGKQMTHETARSAEGSSGGQRSEKVPDPPIFRNDDDDDEDFEQWYRDMENKLEVNSDRYQNDKARQTYIESRLGGKVKRDLAPYLRSGHPDPINTSAKLLTHLWEQYCDPDKEQKALDDWDKLKQETSKNFLAFKNDFVRLAGECQKPRSSWKKEFNRKLTASYQRQLGVSYLDPMVTFEHFARLAQQLAQINKRASQEQAAHRQANPKPAGKADQKKGNATGSNRGAGNRTDGNNKDKPKMTPEAIRKLFDEGRCLHCRQKGHIARNCPNKKDEDKADREARIQALVDKHSSVEPVQKEPTPNGAKVDAASGSDSEN